MKAALRLSFVDAYTFDELVEYGKQHTTNIVNGMPWSFALDCTPHIFRVTHENDNVYIVGATRFERGFVLVVDYSGNAFQINEDSFHKLYKAIPNA